jgi:hypothetical protein
MINIAILIRKDLERTGGCQAAAAAHKYTTIPTYLHLLVPLAL